MKEAMTVKERMIALINMKPIDRLPFWPKLPHDYPDDVRSYFTICRNAFSSMKLSWKYLILSGIIVLECSYIQYTRFKFY